MKQLFYVLKTGLLLVSVLLLSNFNVNGQCTIFGTDLGADQNSDSQANIGGEDGQSFVACSSGTITAISFRTDNNNTFNGTGNLWITTGVPANGLVIAALPVYQVFNISPGGTIITINLNTPFPVVAGNLYSFAFGSQTGAGNFVLDVNDNAPNGPYTDGLGIFNAGQFANVDLNFSITIAPGNPIPTLSQWGLIIFGLLVLNLGLVFVYKKQLITSEASIPTMYIPFKRSAFSKYFIIALSILAAGFIIAMTLFGYELMTFDMPGSVLTAGLLAYLIQLLKHE